MAMEFFSFQEQALDCGRSNHGGSSFQLNSPCKLSRKLPSSHTIHLPFERRKACATSLSLGESTVEVANEFWRDCDQFTKNDNHSLRVLCIYNFSEENAHLGSEFVKLTF